MQVWFTKNTFTPGYTGVAEWNGNRILIRDSDTIETISKAMKTLKAYAMQ